MIKHLDILRVRLTAPQRVAPQRKAIIHSLAFDVVASATNCDCSVEWPTPRAQLIRVVNDGVRFGGNVDNPAPPVLTMIEARGVSLGFG
jgi:hypothetical protein